MLELDDETMKAVAQTVAEANDDPEPEAGAAEAEQAAPVQAEEAAPSPDPAPVPRETAPETPPRAREPEPEVAPVPKAPGFAGSSASEIAERFATMAAGAEARRIGFDLARRRLALQALAQSLRDHDAEIVAALAEDLGKPEPEARLTEILPVLSEINHALKNLKGWTRPRKVKGTRASSGMQGTIRPEPKGTVLIIAPWNFPLGLSLGPLVSALAAGNAAVLKPSEMTPATSALLSRMMAASFDPDLVWVAEGGADVAQALLAKPFDHVFFTGSPATGRRVMALAARHPTPVTLELGGKSPVIVGPGADIKAAARAIVWGKFVNAGQTCIAPDHVYVAADLMERFVTALEAEIARMYGKTPEAQIDSGDLAQIVTAGHYDRIVAMVNQAEEMGATIAIGGAGDAGSRLIAPTVLTGVRPDMAVMQEEIFGPVLPLIPYEDLDAVVARINRGPKPLALYVFEKDKTLIERLCAATSSGGVGVNVTLAHYLHLNLPFGGVGTSGIGAAHGEWGFRAFSHEKPVLVNRRAPLAGLMPPYRGMMKRRKIRLMTRLLGR